MASIDRRPPTGGGATRQMQAARQARRAAVRADTATEQEIERELDRLDDEVVDSDHEELRTLREQSS